MIDIKFIRKNIDKVKKGIKDKGLNIDIDKLLKLDEQRRKLINQIEVLKAEKNKLGKDNIDKARKIKKQIKELEPKLDEKDFNKLLLSVPNLPLDSVPIKGNKVIRKWGKIKKDGKDYLELAENLDIIDVKRAAKVSGTRFGYLKNGAVLLEFGLIQLAFNVLKDFIPIIPPAMIKKEMMQAMGYMERGKMKFIISTTYI